MSSDVLDSTIQAYLPAAAGGDHAAYGRIVLACQSMVTSIALSIVRDVRASEDISQDAFLSAWQNLRKLGNHTSFLPWLRQITRNLARDHLRAQRHRANPPGDMEALLASVADPDPDPEARLEDDQETLIAAGVIDALPEESREVLLLYYREGQSSKQVAALLGMQDSAVRKRLSRARQSVRDELLKQLGEFARQTAPSGAFTAAVLGAMTLASPPAAAAVALTAGGSVLGQGAVKFLGGASLGAFGLAIVSALFGVWLGMRKYLRDPFDAAETRSLLRYGAAMTVMVLLFAFGFAYTVTGAAMAGWRGPMLATSLYALGIVAMGHLWLPRILARRRARDAISDPQAMARLEPFSGQLAFVAGWLLRSSHATSKASQVLAQRRREILCAWGGNLLGLTLGFGGLIYGLFASGRL